MGLQVFQVIQADSWVSLLLAPVRYVNVIMGVSLFSSLTLQGVPWDKISKICDFIFVTNETACSCTIVLHKFFLNKVTCAL